MTIQEEKRKQVPARPGMEIEVETRRPRSDCAVYTWDRERGSLRLAAMQRAEPGLPADLAVLWLEEQLEVPVLLLDAASIAPETLVQARLLGALSAAPLRDEQVLPIEGWMLLAVPEIDASFSSYQSIEMLPPAQVAPLQAYVQAKAREEQHLAGEVQSCGAVEAARLIRETRLALKREKRMQPKGKSWLKREEEERPVAWRAVEGLSQSLRAQLILDRALQEDPNAPYAQAEQLIRFVPQRFQQALADLLLDDERLLAFVERPLLRHRTGLLPMQTWRSNEGLFLVTDRQVLWLRDFLAPGSSFLPGGYIAHMAPLERLQGIAVLPAGKAPPEFAGRLEAKDSPYQRLVMEVASCSGSELFAVEFPQRPEMEKALARISSILRDFLPYPPGSVDRRVRRLSVVEPWVPRGFEAEKLAGLGGIVPQPIAHRLEERLAEVIGTSGEELLASALVPALEEYKSPPRLVALTREALFVIDSTGGKHHHAAGEQVQRCDLATISSAQLRQSLLGSSLSIFVPGANGHTQQHVFPFHSPAIAWFLPLFTRLRLLLTGPYRTQ